MGILSTVGLKYCSSIVEFGAVLSKIKKLNFNDLSSAQNNGSVATPSKCIGRRGILYQNKAVFLYTLV